MKKLKNLTKLDLLFIVFILSLLIKDISIIITNLIESPDPWFYSGSFRAFEKSSTICQISSDTTSTTAYIYNINDSGANAIRSIFIYGIAAYRFNLASTPRARTFIVVGSLVLDSMMRVLSKIITNPNYIVELVQNWRSLWTRSLEFLDFILFFLFKKKEAATADEISILTNTLNGSNEDKIINLVLGYLKPVLAPVSVDYSNQVLANQIYGVSILLFILSILIIILLIAFIFNIIILVYSDKIMSLFTNKYIRWYIALNKKVIGIEIIFLSGTLLYFMYTLSSGIHFIATHPIIL